MQKTIQTSTIAVIGGFGKIGTELRNRLQSMGCERILTGARHNSPQDMLETGVNLAFLAIPTEDDGTIARNYLVSFLEQDIPVVTCEKGALANRFAHLQPHLHNIGYSATVGGGSDLIHALQRRMTKRPRAIHVILNGTVNYIWGRLAQGATLEQAVHEARRLGLVEPGEGYDEIRTIQQELHSDALYKAAILFNVVLRSSSHVQREAFNFRWNVDQIQKQTRLASSRRFVISFYTTNRVEGVPEEERPLSFHDDGSRYAMSVGFKSLHDAHIRRLCEATPGACNGFLTVEREDGTCLHVGEGAGPGPTAAAMIQDAEALLAIRTT